MNGTIDTDDGHQGPFNVESGETGPGGDPDGNLNGRAQRQEAW